MNNLMEGNYYSFHVIQLLVWLRRKKRTRYFCQKKKGPGGHKLIYVCGLPEGPEPATHVKKSKTHNNPTICCHCHTVMKLLL